MFRGFTAKSGGHGNLLTKGDKFGGEAVRGGNHPMAALSHGEKEKRTCENLHLETLIKKMGETKCRRELGGYKKENITHCKIPSSSDSQKSL